MRSFLLFLLASSSGLSAFGALIIHHDAPGRAYSRRFYFKPVPSPHFDPSSSASVPASTVASVSSLPALSAPTGLRDMFLVSAASSASTSIAANAWTSRMPTVPTSVTQLHVPGDNRDRALHGRDSFHILGAVANVFQPIGTPTSLVAPTASPSVLSAAGTLSPASTGLPHSNQSTTGGAGLGASTSVAAQLAALASMLAADDAALLSMVASAANTGARANAPGGALFGVILDALVDGLAVSDAARLAGVISALHGTGSLQGLGHGTDVPGVVLPGAGL